MLNGQIPAGIPKNSQLTLIMAGTFALMLIAIGVFVAVRQRNQTLPIVSTIAQPTESLPIQVFPLAPSSNDIYYLKCKVDDIVEDKRELGSNITAFLFIQCKYLNKNGENEQVEIPVSFENGVGQSLLLGTSPQNDNSYPIADRGFLDHFMNIRPGVVIQMGLTDNPKYENETEAQKFLKTLIKQEYSQQNVTNFAKDGDPQHLHNLFIPISLTRINA